MNSTYCPGCTIYDITVDHNCYKTFYPQDYDFEQGRVAYEAYRKFKISAGEEFPSFDELTITELKAWSYMVNVVKNRYGAQY